MNPNLFNFATSELSQYPVLCWLLSWADVQYTKSPLHGIGKALLELIYTRAGMKVTEFISVSVENQQEYIDILCVVNKETAIVIEDKVNTKQHSGQLDKYRLHVTTALGYAPNNLILVYIQTGDQSDYGPVLKSGYLIISRADLLGVFEAESAQTAKDQSEILRDFSAYLRRIEDDVQSYRTTPPAKWSWEAWKGFYSSLQSEMGDGHWEHVAKALFEGSLLPLLRYSWHFGGDDTFKVYLQLEHEKLRFAMWSNDDDKRRDLFQHWHDRIMTAGKAHGLSIKQPSQFERQHMTQVSLATDYRMTDDDGLLDMGKTLDLLQVAQAALNDYIKTVVN